MHLHCSPAALFYLRRTRLVAASPVGSRSTSSQYFSEREVLESAYEILHDMLVGCVPALALLTCSVWHCLAVPLRVVMHAFNVITPAEIAACLFLAQMLPAWLAEPVALSWSWCFSALPLFLSVAVLHCVQTQKHMPTEASCRWLSAAVVHALYPGHAMVVAAFFFPTFGIGEKKKGACKRPAGAGRGSSRASLATPSRNVRRQGKCKRDDSTLKPSAYCKNAKCMGSNGHPRRKVSGCRGYCRQCVVVFEPDVVSYVRKKSKEGDQKRAHKFPCSRCGATYYYKIDPNTKKHYCKACWPLRSAEEHPVLRCKFCFAKGSAVDVRVCSITEGCGRETIMCTNCLDLSKKPVCTECWRVAFGGGCLNCKAAVSTTLSCRFRFCATCYNSISMDAADDVLLAICFYCRSQAGNVQTVGCQYEAGCPGYVNVCGTCLLVHENVPCSVCYKREWCHNCYGCNERLAQYNTEQYGYYCKKCFWLHTERGRRELLAEEVSTYQRNLAITAAPTGEEAALQSLVLPIHDGPELASYAEEPTYLSPVHCRICLANCEHVQVPATNTWEDVPATEGSEREAVQFNLPLPSQKNGTIITPLKEQKLDEQTIGRNEAFLRRGETRCIEKKKKR